MEPDRASCSVVRQREPATLQIQLDGCATWVASLVKYLNGNGEVARVLHVNAKRASRCRSIDGLSLRCVHDAEAPHHVIATHAPVIACMAVDDEAAGCVR